MPVESEIVDEGIDDEAIEVQRPAKLEAEHHVARGIAGRHERRELGREDDDPLVAIVRKMTLTTNRHKTNCSSWLRQM